MIGGLFNAFFFLFDDDKIGVTLFQLLCDFATELAVTGHNDMLAK